MLRSSDGKTARPSNRLLSISLIKCDPSTQHRARIDPQVVAKYAALMKDGVEFPPIKVWWDGEQYWLTDGFHRIAAAERAKLLELACEVSLGSLEDARWDSYSVNGTHGSPRTAQETKRIISLALKHSNAGFLSSTEIAKHLHISEATVRRWRRKLANLDTKDKIRYVTRGGTTYPMSIANLGKRRKVSQPKSLSMLRHELDVLKNNAPPRIRRVLVIIGNWALGQATPSDCLQALHRVLPDEANF
jgi:hypothetical protein